jgi:hypothetical protein
MVAVSRVVIVVVAIALAPAHDSLTAWSRNASSGEDQPVNLLDDVVWA